MTNYQLGKIYRIVCNLTGNTYYGSTCESTLARRLANHVKNFKCFKDNKTKKYVASFKILEGGNYTIVLVELFPCDKKIELHRRERFFIEGNDCVNKNIPTRTRAEYRVDNRSHNIEYSAKYRLENAEKLKIHRAENAEKLKIRRAENAEKLKIQHAEYYKENSEKIQMRNAEYKAINKEKIKTQRAKDYQKTKEARLAKLNVPIM
jgi:hypothetical protein